LSRPKKSPGPIYAFALTWLILSLMLPMYKLAGLAAVAIVSLAVGFFAGTLAKKRQAKSEPPQPEPVKEPEPAKSYGPTVDPIVADGKRAIGEMGRLYSSIQDPGVRQKINELMRITDKITQDAIADPSDVPQIKKFMNYYLPTTIKLLNSYDRMGSQGIEGDNLTKSMKSIEDMLDTAIAAYKKQLDSLFADQAMDIETDIQVMNQMLDREGLSGSRDFDVTSQPSMDGSTQISKENNLKG
jgi:5-bromo-4-chloroindolyl phosphate hydrolysis protein